MARGIYISIHVGDGTQPGDKIFEAKWPAGQKPVLQGAKAEIGHGLVLSLLVADQERSLAIEWGESATPHIEVHDTPAPNPDKL